MLSMGECENIEVLEATHKGNFHKLTGSSPKTSLRAHGKMWWQQTQENLFLVHS